MTHTRHRSKLWILLAAGSLAVMPGAVILPVLREIKQQFGLDIASVGWLASIHYLTVALFSPILGILADRIGRTKVLVASLLFFSLFGIAGTWTTSFLPMLATRTLLGAATGGIAAASLGILAQMYQQGEDRSQAIALASSAITLANIVYPLTAGLIGSDHWQWAFYLYGIGIPIALIAAFKLAEPSEFRAKNASSLLGSSSQILAIIGNPQVLCFFVTLTLTSATAYATVTNMPLYFGAEPINASTAMIGMVLTAHAIGSAVASAVGLKFLIRRLGTILSIGLGFAMMALSLILLPALHQIELLLPAAILFGVGLGIVMPSHYGALANLTPPDFQSTVLAIGTGMTFLGQFLSPGLFTVLFRSDKPTTTFYIAATIALGTGLFLLASSRKMIQAEMRSGTGSRSSGGSNP